MRAYITAPNPSKIHPAPRTALKRPSEFGILAIISLALAATLVAADPPPDIARRVAHRETETAQERGHYTYTQSIRLVETDTKNSQTGEYREVREVIFSPEGERTERFQGEPVSHLKNIILTPEDFSDIRDIQPFVLTEDRLRLYETEYKGEEPVGDTTCWVLSVRPRQILSGQRLFDGLLWIREDDFSVMKSEGKAVPQIITLKQENLFPRFTTTRRLINGFWFPAITAADDTLNFRKGSIREKLTLRYEDYKRFGADTSITFEK
jgi:hypothetical protein